MRASSVRRFARRCALRCRTPADAAAGAPAGCIVARSHRRRRRRRRHRPSRWRRRRAAGRRAPTARRRAPPHPPPPRRINVMHMACRAPGTGRSTGHAYAWQCRLHSAAQAPLRAERSARASAHASATVPQRAPEANAPGVRARASQAPSARWMGAGLA